MSQASGPILVRTQKPVVLRRMNESQGEIYWSATDHRWRNLLACRNEYVRSRLHHANLSLAQWRALPKPARRFHVTAIEMSFSDDEEGFFKFTRDGDWMQDAVGEKGDWTKIEGMATWHVAAALIALEQLPRGITPPFGSDESESQLGSRTEDGSAEGPGRSEKAGVYDPVRDVFSG